MRLLDSVLSSAFDVRVSLTREACRSSCPGLPRSDIIRFVVDKFYTRTAHIGHTTTRSILADFRVSVQEMTALKGREMVVCTILSKVCSFGDNPDDLRTLNTTNLDCTTTYFDPWNVCPLHAAHAEIKLV